MQGLRRHAQPGVCGPEELDQPAGVHRLDAATHDRAEDGDRDLEAPLERRDRVRVAELLPGRRHELLLRLLDDDDAEPGDRARGGVEIQLAQPGGRLRVAGYRRACSLPAAVDGRGHDRIADGGAQKVAQRLPERGTRRRPLKLAGGNERPLELQHAGVGKPERLAADAEPAPADVAGGARLQPARERLEVAAGTGRELPVVVDGQPHRGLSCGPGRAEAILVGRLHLLAQTGLPPGLERRYDAGQVVGLGLQAPRANEP